MIDLLDKVDLILLAVIWLSFTYMCIQATLAPFAEFDLKVLVWCMWVAGSGVIGEVAHLVIYRHW